MNNEDIKLLLTDLSARLTFGVKIQKINEPESAYRLYSINTNTGELKFTTFEGDSLSMGDSGYLARVGKLRFKPYLRPMSSMTEEECDMVEEILGDKCIFDFMSNGDIILKQGQFSQNKLAKLCDYYASIHVDYRDLIQMGLALEAPEGMY